MAVATVASSVAVHPQSVDVFVHPSICLSVPNVDDSIPNSGVLANEKPSSGTPTNDPRFELSVPASVTIMIILAELMTTMATLAAAAAARR